MKKLLGISLVALFAVAPMMANAAAVAGDPTSAGENTTGITADSTANGPKWALAAANSETDKNAASAGYVKGAYNAAMKAINYVHDEAVDAKSAVNNLDTTVTSQSGTDKVVISVTQTDGLLTSATAEIGAGSISSAALATSAVTSGAIAAGAVTSAALATSAVTSGAIAADAVTSAAIATGAVGADEIATGAVGADEIATSAVGTAEIDNGSILVEDIATSAMAAGSGTYANSSALAQQGYVDEKVAGLNIGDYATKTGVENTINSVTLNVGTFELTSGAVSGSVTVPIMDDWSHPDTPASSELAANATLSVGTAITNGTVTIDSNSVNYAAANSAN